VSAAGADHVWLKLNGAAPPRKDLLVPALRRELDASRKETAQLKRDYNQVVIEVEAPKRRPHPPPGR